MLEYINRFISQYLCLFPICLSVCPFVYLYVQLHVCISEQTLLNTAGGAASYISDAIRTIKQHLQYMVIFPTNIREARAAISSISVGEVILGRMY